MDSMRSLNTSLPTASPSRRQRRQPPEHLLQTFKQAALSVTNLYKAAALDSDRIYREGYQDALEELLGFLDKENLGLQDGEGWSVRQWATERFEGSPAPNGSGESDDEHEDENTTKITREASPVMLRRKTSQEIRPEPVAALRSSPSHTRSESAPPITAAPPSSSAELNFPQRTANANLPMQAYTVPQADFTFQSSHQYPGHDMDMDASTDNSGTVHINVLPRGTRQSRQNSRALGRQGSQLGHGAGMKRRMPNFDFFDLGGFHGKDGFGGGGGAGGGAGASGGGGGGGGGKRGRYS